MAYHFFAFHKTASSSDPENHIRKTSMFREVIISGVDDAFLMINAWNRICAERRRDGIREEMRERMADVSKLFEENSHWKDHIRNERENGTKKKWKREGVSLHFSISPSLK